MLFADIKDSMDLLESLDPEDARRLVDPALEIMVEVVRRFNRRVVQSTGDGIFALFGAPIAHEDHPQRAIYAGLELQERIRRYSDTLRESGRLPIFVRVGVNTVEVVVRSVRTDDQRVEYTPIGHPTSLASRLQSLATPGAVVVGEQTRKLCEGFFQFRALGPHNIKGVSQPVTAYEVVELGPLRTRLEAAARRGLVKFVGREAELIEIRRALERVQSGHGQIVGVVGEAGVGKSRLFHQFKATLGGGFKMLETSGVAHAKGWVYLPLVEMLQKYFDFDFQPDDDGVERRRKIENRLTQLDPGLLDTLPYVSALLGVLEADDPIAGMDGQLRKHRTLEAIKRLLVRESLAQPLLIIFEDLHWFDAESLEFLTLLADSLPALRMLMLVNHRPGFAHPSHAKSYYRQLRLDPLEANNADQLLSVLLTDAAELGPFKKLIIEKSEGNPLFIEEIVRALFENGTIVREGEQVRVTRPHAEISIPATVEGIVAARIDRLLPEEKSLLQSLAVIGEEFPLPLARHALGKPENELLRSLASLQSAEFIYERPTTAQTEYIFKHALIHDVAYKSVLQERRKAIHGKTAETIEKLYANRLDDHLDQLVHHYRLSGNGPKTVHYLHQAGQHAYERSAVADALTHFNAALETVRQMPSDGAVTELELALQISLGNSLMSTGGYAAEGTAKAFERARELCGMVGDSSQLVPALFGLWAFHNFGGKLKAAQELGEELLSIAKRRQDPATLLHNGGFLVFRKLAQDVKGFQSFVERATRNGDGSNNPDRAKLLSAKMIGRWPSGAPLTLAPEKDNQELGSNKYRNKDFGFATTDHDGFACPVGSHIRRANPRDALAFPPDPKLSLNIANRHRIIRRGRPYREALAASGNEVEQGLLFLAINASLVRQFEFIQQSWLNNPKFNGLYDERDPLSSAIAGGDAMMTMQAKPVRERLDGLPRFVTVRGAHTFSCLRFGR